MHNATFTNGKVTFHCDLVFGLCVLATDGWVPFSELDNQTQQLVRAEADWDPIFRPIHHLIYDDLVVQDGKEAEKNK